MLVFYTILGQFQNFNCLYIKKEKGESPKKSCGMEDLRTIGSDNQKLQKRSSAVSAKTFKNRPSNYFLFY